MERWVCTQCGAFRPRVDAEGVSPQGNPESWLCKRCGMKGTFVPENSAKGSAMANHLSVETYHDRLESAGYSLEWPKTPLTQGAETAKKGLRQLLKRVVGRFGKRTP